MNYYTKIMKQVSETPLDGEIDNTLEEDSWVVLEAEGNGEREMNKSILDVPKLLPYCT